MHRLTLRILLIMLAVLPACRWAESNHAKGLLTVDGKPLIITQAYAFAQKGFFDPTKDDVVILLCDAAVPPEAIRDPFARRDLVKAGKLHCVQQTINSQHEVINFKVEHSRFGMPETGGSTEHVFESRDFDATKISGRAYTKSPQKSFDDVPYTYDITFNATVKPKK